MVSYSSGEVLAQCVEDLYVWNILKVLLTMVMAYIPPGDSGGPNPAHVECC